jgi:HD-like signal output (HDOD) protein
MFTSADLPAGRIELPPPDLEAWTRFFLSAELPVLAETADMIEALRRNEDAVDAHLIAEQLGGDPLITLKLLAHASSLRARQGTSVVETPLAALVLMGITPFFRAFGPQPTAEQQLQGKPAALNMLHGLVACSRRAAYVAQELAAHRNDPDVAVIREAALLHDFARMLIVCQMPELAEQINQADGALIEKAEAAATERQLLGVGLADLQQALAISWRLPEVLVQMHDETQRLSSQVRNVLLAARIARLPAGIWARSPLSDALEQHLHEVEELLRLARGAALNLLRDLDQ